MTDLDRWRQIEFRAAQLLEEWAAVLKDSNADAQGTWSDELMSVAGSLRRLCGTHHVAEAVAEERERCIQAARNNQPMPLADFRRNTLMLQSWCADGGKELIDGYADYLSDSYVRAIRQPAPDEAAR